MLNWAVVLVLGLSAVSQAEWMDNKKLINPEDIATEFKQGKERVKVIVNLVEPPEITKAIDWNSLDSLQVLHTEIEAIEAPVLSSLSTNEFKLRYRFENQAGFSGEVTLDALEKLLSNPRIESIEPVYELKLQTRQGIPLMNASAYRSMYNGAGTAIAIVDTGIDYMHPKLGGAPLAINNKVIDGNDFGCNDPDPMPDQSVCPDDSGYPENHAHGTCCAGIAAGDLGSVGDYIGGVAPGAKLYALKVIDENCQMWTDAALKAWEWCVNNKNLNPDNPILVISHSLGGGRYKKSEDDTRYAEVEMANRVVQAGITLLAASGNEGYSDSIGAPACLNNIISVGAVYDADLGNVNLPAVPCSEYARIDNVPCYSNTAYFLDILAPATNAYTTDIVGQAGYTSGNYFENYGGTSAACPYAAGAVACLQSAAKELTGEFLSPHEIRHILRSTGDAVTDPKADITKPRINLARAIEKISYLHEYQAEDAMPKSIPDRGTVTSTLVIPESGIIEDLDVKLKISHTRLEDLDVVLITPDGTRIPLLTDVGGSDDNLEDTILDDEASIWITEGKAPLTGPYCPERSLADFISLGKELSGTWTLEITDDRSGISGTLNSWSLFVTLEKPSSSPDIQPEPEETPGSSNTIYWDQTANGGDGLYLAECATDENFDNVIANSPWIPDTSYTFTGLTPNQEYWYRVKCRPLDTWSETSQCDFETDERNDTEATPDGDVVLAGWGEREVQVHVITDPSFELCIEWQPLANTDKMFWACYKGLPFVRDGIKVGGVEVTTSYYVSSTNFGWLATQVDWTGVDTLVFDYFSAYAGDVLEGQVLIGGTLYQGGTVVWPKPDCIEEPITGGYEVRAPVSAFTGRQYLKLRVDVKKSGFNLAGLYWDNFRTYDRQSEVGALSGSIVSPLLSLAADDEWGAAAFNATTPAGAALTADALPATGSVAIPGYEDIPSGADLSGISDQTIRLRANLSTSNPPTKPALHDWSITYINASRESDWCESEHSKQIP